MRAQCAHPVSATVSLSQIPPDAAAAAVVPKHSKRKSPQKGEGEEEAVAPTPKRARKHNVEEGQPPKLAVM